MPQIPPLPFGTLTPLSVHALNYMLTKLITGFGCCMEHYVGEEPKSEANCCSRKRALFTGEGAECGGAEIHG